MTIEYKCGFQVVEDDIAYCAVDVPIMKSPYRVTYPYSGCKCRDLLHAGDCPKFKTEEEVEASTWLHRMTFD